VATLPQKRGISSPKPLHVFRQSVASLRRNAISATNFSDLQDPPVFSPVATYKSFFEQERQENSNRGVEEEDETASCLAVDKHRVAGYK
jgi:hypothetical protein